MHHRHPRVVNASQLIYYIVKK